LDRSSALTFVIPTEVEGSAVLSTSIRFGPKLHPNLCHPDRSGGICGSTFRPQKNCHENELIFMAVSIPKTHAMH
jgi:hypothetical protein